jgi:ABC-type nickel/cobalt efflux system permease component RcnA
MGETMSKTTIRVAFALFAAACAVSYLAPLAHAQSSLGIGTNEATLPSTGLFAPLLNKVNLYQQEFYRSLTGALKAMRTDGSKLWLLVGLSFAYGIFHAAGPGHGKAVISSYMLANEVALKRGVMLAFVSAFAQAFTAIVVMTLIYLVLRGTAINMTNATWFLEVVSYALISCFGAWLLWKKAAPPLRHLVSSRPAHSLSAAAQDERHVHGHADRDHAHHSHDDHADHIHHHGDHAHDDDHDGHAHGHDHGDHDGYDHDDHDIGHDDGGLRAVAAAAAPVAALRSSVGHDHRAEPHNHAHGHDHAHVHHGHAHDHEHGDDCGHLHAPDPAMLAGDRFDWRTAWSAVAAVGLRPCSGALIVLTFAFLNGLWVGGILSVLAMAVGTGITVAILATIAVTAKNVAVRLAGADGPVGAGIHTGIEIAGAAFVLIVGLLLLGASLMA